MSFISGDGSYLLRIIENKISGNLKGHLIHPLHEKYQQVFIDLAGLHKQQLPISLPGRSGLEKSQRLLSL